MDNQEQKQGELRKLQDDLQSGTLSRRQFLDRVKVLGLGFGAATLAGAGAAQAHTGAEAFLQSSNPALDTIIEEGREKAALENDEPHMQTAQYYRYGRYGRYQRYQRYQRYFRYQRYQRYQRYFRYQRYQRYARHHGFGGYGRYSRYSRFY